jgi:hypothetical protein
MIQSISATPTDHSLLAASTAARLRRFVPQLPVVGREPSWNWSRSCETWVVVYQVELPCGRRPLALRETLMSPSLVVNVETPSGQNDTQHQRRTLESTTRPALGRTVIIPPV